MNTSLPGMSISYWRERNHEVDFIIRYGDRVLPVEVNSGRNKGALAGLSEFGRQFPSLPGLIVGTGGIPLEVFLTTPPQNWLLAV
jgi:hypothetical protein